MKIRILKNVLVEVEKTRLQEVWDKQLYKWDELNVESINVAGKSADICTYEGDILLAVPTDYFVEI
jgi:hypothetical protein